ncbi:DUF1811 family protein [Paenibacillus sp.]|uniref:DUF1811 family protein n=1 Tax=Paenibacillus sp. TaxID=58172 RepID=UPI00281171F0|nr:DUF1811 family protein [Paenibacillus sp.]
MKRFSEMSPGELAEEIERLRSELDRSASEGEKGVLRQRWLLARSYAVRDASFPPGRYRVEETGAAFTLLYVNGVMGWGTTEDGQEAAFPLAVLQREEGINDGK